MPATFAHPLAVLPLKRRFPRHLDFAGLVIGSMSPDIGYLLHAAGMATIGHSLGELLRVCLPGGLAVWGVFRMLRVPLCAILPQPHRGVLMNLAERAPSFSWQLLARVVLSILVGAWTHIFWDSFTHARGWPVGHWALLRYPLLRIDGIDVPVFNLLQHLSTLGGTIALWACYFRWVRRRRGRQPVAPAGPADSLSDSLRYALLGFFAVVSVSIAVPLALPHNPHGGFDVRVFVVCAGVGSLTLFLGLAALGSLLLYWFSSSSLLFRNPKPRPWPETSMGK